MYNQKKTISLIGSTGSIGSSAFEILKNNLNIFDINILLGFDNFEFIYQQAKILNPKIIFISKKYIEALKEMFQDAKIKIFPTEEFENIFLSEPLYSDITLLSVKGFLGLKFCLNLIPFSKRIALANKESIICGGEILINRIKEYECELVPVDSEHNTIFQLLNGISPDKREVEQMIITASGGPFFKTILDGKAAELKNITFSDAAKHPKWKMGVEISINSATLMNKAQELIEAFYLFGFQNIKAIIHPQSIVHGILNLKNGMSMFGASNPDMKLHIGHSFFYPDHCIRNVNIKKLNFSEIGSLDFFEIKNWPFEFVDIAYDIIKNKDLSRSIIMNAANEIALSLFLKREIGFLELSNFVVSILNKFKFSQPRNFADIEFIDSQVRCNYK